MHSRKSSKGPGQMSGMVIQVRITMMRSTRKAIPRRDLMPGLLTAMTSRTKISSKGPGTKSGKMIQSVPRAVMMMPSALVLEPAFRSSLTERSGLTMRSERTSQSISLSKFRLLRLRMDFLLSGASLVDWVCYAGPFIRSMVMIICFRIGKTSVVIRIFRC